jgi:predicted permease
MMNTLLQDIRYGFRMLKRKPMFTAIAVLTLALGIGANSAIFTLVNTILLRPLPVAAPDELVSLAVSGKNDSLQAFSYPTYRDYRDRNEVLSGLYATRLAPMSLSRDGNNERIWGVEVTGNYFDILGVGAVHGRTFRPEEDRTPLSHPVVVLSYESWQRRFGGDPATVGQQILINGHNFEIIGITPEGFSGTDLVYTPEVWVPMMMQEWIEPGNAWLEARRTQNMFATGRLKPGVTNEQAEASLNVLASQLAQEYPDTNEGQKITLMPPGFILPRIRGAVISFTIVLMSIVALVLLIACTNLASLLLARATERRKEIAIRLSMGASRARLIRQLLTESLLLALAGGAAGLIFAIWIIDFVVALKPPIDIPLWINLRVDWRVLLFSLLASLATSLLFGLVPALQATKADIVPALKDTASQAGHRRSWLRSGLVVAQVAFSLFLLIAAGLIVRALQQLQEIGPGFDTRNGLVMSFDLSLQGYDQARGEQFHRQLKERVESLPGVSSASYSDLFPLSLNYSGSSFYVEGETIDRGANVPTAMVASIGLDYFPTMGVTLLTGRDFTEKDDEKANPVVIVNEAFVNRILPNAASIHDALGKRVKTSPEGRLREIVGVAKDGKYWTVGEAPQPFVYFPLLQSYSPTTTLIVRTNSDAQSMIGAIRSEVQKLDANLPLYDVRTFTEHVGVSLFPARIAATLSSSFGLLALILSTIGIYGVVSYSVAQRTREIGIRMALGAQSVDVLRLIAGRGMALALVGISIGIVIAFAFTRFMESLLYGVSATDPVTFAVITLLLAAVALAACYIPARRATKVDPMVALRHE